MRKFINKKVLAFCLVLLITLVCVIQVTSFNGLALTEVKEPVKYQESNGGKISEELSDKANQLSSNDLISVSVWIKDIDVSKIAEETKEQLAITDVKKASEETVSQYIKTTRKLAYIQQSENNNNFYQEIKNNAQAIYISGYTPNLLLKVKKKDLSTLAANENVEGLDIFIDETKVNETVNSIPAISADYTKNLGCTGNGVNVGILEYSDDTHAATVKNIITDIAPSANIMMKYAHNKSEDYAKIEELIQEGANVINYSAGYTTDTGVYTEFAQYIDYIVKNYNITFVKSAGNIKSDNKITDPGMAYNAIVVGSINENDTSSWTDDVLSTFSCFEEVSGASKPDFTAPGEGIYGSKSGTSYSAPHVVGVVAQLMGLNPGLKGYPGAIKSILATGTRHTTADDYGEDLWSPCYSDKEGAGVIDAKGAYNILKSSTLNYSAINNSQFPYTGTFYISSLNKNVRVSLTWLKQDKLADLDLRVYDPNNNLVAYSLSSSNNTELLEFNPRSYRGTYKFVVEGYSLPNSQEDVCVSWKQAD